MTFTKKDIDKTFSVEEVIKEYRRIEQEEELYDSDEIFTRIIELHVDRNKLSSNQAYFVLIGQHYMTIKEFVRSTY